MTSQLVYSVDSIRNAERLALEQEGITSWSLMQRAAQAAFSVMRRHYPNLSSVAIFCGSGNNAGDGLLLAALSQASGIATQVFLSKDIDTLKDTPAKAAQTALDAGIVFAPLAAYGQAQADVFVDALLGIGVVGPVHGPVAEVIGWLNSQKIAVFSLDVPSGLDADTGAVLGMAVKAKHSVTFIGSKCGLHTAYGPDHVGELSVETLGLERILQSLQPTVKLISDATVRAQLTVRPKNCHKGYFGHVLLIGGGRGMPGAIMLAAKAALRVGAGLVTIATRPEHINGALGFIPESMVYGVNSGRQLRALLSKATVVVLGPGLGKDRWAQSLYRTAIRWQGPKVVDASALRMLAENPFVDQQRVLTPHSGEAAELLGCSSDAVQENRLQALNGLHEKYGGTVVLKGCGSLVAANNRLPYLCDAGNPGMATGGMGDVLSGVIAGLLAQKISPFNAASLGVYVHAQAADCAAAQFGSRGLLASDLIGHLSNVVNP